jgi:hypothetical protein
MLTAASCAVVLQRLLHLSKLFMLFQFNDFGAWFSFSRWWGIRLGTGQQHNLQFLPGETVQDYLIMLILVALQSLHVGRFLDGFLEKTSVHWRRTDMQRIASSSQALTVHNDPKGYSEQRITNVCSVWINEVSICINGVLSRTSSDLAFEICQIFLEALHSAAKSQTAGAVGAVDVARDSSGASHNPRPKGPNGTNALRWIPASKSQVQRKISKTIENNRKHL